MSFDCSYNHRSISDDELAKVKDRIDNKIARRQQQTTKTSTPPVATTTSNPTPPPATTYNLPITTMDTSMPTYDKDEYSIFREAPVTRPTTVSERINRICEEYYCALG